jgi:hypothetical protein
MTDSDTQAETWQPIPGYPFYEVSDCGRVRSVAREAHGRTYRSIVLSTRVSNSGYLLVNLRDEKGERQTRTVHTLVLAAFVGPRPRGQESMHLNNDPLDNRVENLAYGSHPENVEAQFGNGRPRAAPKPPKVCIRCSAEFEGAGRRCHACVVEIGEQAARLLVAGVPLDQVAERLDYPSLGGALTLAQKYGGLRLVLAAPEPQPSQRVSVTRSYFRRLLGRDAP